MVLSLMIYSHLRDIVNVDNLIEMDDITWHMREVVWSLERCNDAVDWIEVDQALMLRKSGDVHLSEVSFQSHQGEERHV